LISAPKIKQSRRSIEQRDCEPKKIYTFFTQNSHFALSSTINSQILKILHPRFSGEMKKFAGRADLKNDANYQF
jgi:predicted NUDIX family NTP pyrophosphohydrolase